MRQERPVEENVCSLKRMKLPSNYRRHCCRYFQSLVLTACYTFVVLLLLKRARSRLRPGSARRYYMAICQFIRHFHFTFIRREEKKTALWEGPKRARHCRQVKMWSEQQRSERKFSRDDWRRVRRVVVRVSLLFSVNNVLRGASLHLNDVIETHI